MVNRIDRKPFTPGRCGEVRFVYRLAYDATDSGGFGSRVPLTMNVVFLQAADADGSCLGAARRWLVPEGHARDTA